MKKDRKMVEKLEIADFANYLRKTLAHYRKESPAFVYEATNGEMIADDEIEDILFDVASFAENGLISNIEHKNCPCFVIGYREDDRFVELETWDFEEVADELDIPLVESVEDIEDI